MKIKISGSYIWFFFPLPVTLICTILFFSFWLEPYSGDLTRLGGYAENLYGWEVSQKKLPKTLHHIQKYNQYFDVVVFGDSFSYIKPGQQNEHGSYWQDFLINQTGLSVIVFDLNNTDLDEILNSSIFKVSPPKVFIYENIERDLVYVPSFVGLNDKNTFCEVSAPLIGRSSTIAPLNLKLIDYKRNNGEKNSFLDKVNQASNLLKKRLANEILGLNLTKVYKLNLVNQELFSSQKSDSLLVYENDFLKAKWSDNQIETVRCQLIRLQNKVQENNKTFFIFMAIPDKLTVYKNVISTERNINISKLSDFSAAGFHFLSIISPLKIAIKNNNKDVYLPNDTHWGSRGHQIASDYLINYFIDNNLLVNKSQISPADPAIQSISHSKPF